MRRTILPLVLAALLVLSGCAAAASAEEAPAPTQTPMAAPTPAAYYDWYYDPSMWAGCDEMPDVVENAAPVREEIETVSADPGGYSSGLPELDAVIGDILREIGADEMSDYRALMAAFRYVAENFNYVHHEIEEYGFDDGVSWTAHRALVFFQNGGGVCYDYASAFCVLARALGYDAYNVVGSVFGRDHGYVCIPQEDMLVLYDTELASIEPELYPDLTLFQFLDTDGDYECYFWE